MEDNNNAVITKRPPFWACITIVTFLAVILVAQILVFGSPDVHMTMIFALAFSSVVLSVCLNPLWLTGQTLFAVMCSPLALA